MESLNMNTLAKSLPSSSSTAKVEQELMEKFKAAAMSITTFYRSSLKASKNHYNAGYEAALKDLMTVIQQGVSAGGIGIEDESGMTIGRVMDWIEARLEAVKIKDSEEEEEEEEKESKGKALGTSIKAGGVNDARDKAKGKAKTSGETSSTSLSSLPTPRSPDSLTSRPHLQSVSMTPSSPSPPPTSRTTTRSRLRSQNQNQNLRDPQAIAAPEPLGVTQVNRSAISLAQDSQPQHPYIDDTHRYTLSPSVSSIIGAKRRHVSVQLEASSEPLTSFDSFDSGITSPNSINGSGTLSSLNASDVSRSNVLTVAPVTAGPNHMSRRRLRNSRSSVFTSSILPTRTVNINSNAQQGISDVMMDLEDEGGRERKRVARR